MSTHSKLNVATRQLESAVMLFCSGRDRFSAITLAGAADVIISQLLKNEGKDNFSDDLMKYDAETTGVMPDRTAHGRAVNDTLMINAMKHMDPGDSEYVEMDVKVSALATVAKAVANYVRLAGDKEGFIEVFRMWAQLFTPKGLDSDGQPIR